MFRLEALRAFVEVADHGNIKDAADRLFRTPSAVSMTLRQIEDRLGWPLFETDRKSNLSAMGRFLYDQAVIVLRDYDRAMERIEAQARARSGRLRIASVPSVATMLLPRFLQDFTATRPDLEVDLVDTDSTDVRHLVETGQVDLGIAGLAADVPGLASLPIFRDPFHLICHRDSALGQAHAALDWSDLAGESLILNEAARSLASPAFQQLAREARFSVRNVTSLIAMVQTGIGITLLPALATGTLPADLVALPLKDQAGRRTVCLLSRLGRVDSPVALAFRQDFARAARLEATRLGLEVVT